MLLLIPSQSFNKFVLNCFQIKYTLQQLHRHPLSGHYSATKTTKNKLEHHCHAPPCKYIKTHQTRGIEPSSVTAQSPVLLPPLPPTHGLNSRFIIPLLILGRSSQAEDFCSLLHWQQDASGGVFPEGGSLVEGMSCIHHDFFWGFWSRLILVMFNE